MKKIFLGLIAATLSIIVIQSCNKGTALKYDNAKTTTYFSTKFLNDPTFYQFITTLSKNNLKMAKILKIQNSTAKYTPTDSNSVYLAAAENLTATYFLEEKYPDFASLPVSQQTNILNIIGDSLSSVTYRAANPQNLLIKYESETIPKLIEQDSVAIEAKFSFNHISSGEFWTCTVGIGAAALSSYGSILGDLKWLVQNGSNAWGAVLSLAFDLVKNACPWYKVAAMAIGYATCLWNAGQS